MLKCLWIQVRYNKCCDILGAVPLPSFDCENSTNNEHSFQNKKQNVSALAINKKLFDWFEKYYIMCEWVFWDA